MNLSMHESDFSVVLIFSPKITFFLFIIFSVAKKLESQHFSTFTVA